MYCLHLQNQLLMVMLKPVILTTLLQRKEKSPPVAFLTIPLTGKRKRIQHHLVKVFRKILILKVSDDVMFVIDGVIRFTCPIISNIFERLSSNTRKSVLLNYKFDTKVFFEFLTSNPVKSYQNGPSNYSIGYFFQLLFFFLVNMSLGQKEAKSLFIA